ncbi:MAG: protein translocase subunit SecD [Pseudomonadota bacterium]
MLQFSRFQAIATLGVVLFGLVFALPNVLSEDQRAALPGFLPKSTMNLGLDLQGGSYLLLKVDTDKVIGDRLTSLGQDVRTRFRDRGGEGGRISTRAIRPDKAEQRLEIVLRDPATLDNAMERVRDATRVGLDLGGLAGGLSSVQPYNVTTVGDATIRITMTDEAQRSYAREAVTDSIEVVRRRIDPAGNKEVSIQPQGTDRIVVQVPGDNDPEALKNVINQTGQLTFHPADLSVPVPEIGDWASLDVDEESQCPEVSGMPPGRMVRRFADEEGGGALVLERTPVITGDMVVDASASPDPDNGGFQINFKFDNRGARRFSRYTRDNIGQVFAIVLDCRVISAPNIQSPITGGSGRITGRFTADEAVRVSTLIRAGALPAPLQTIEQRTVGAGLGQDSIKAGSRAVIIGFIAVIFYMVISYGRFGLYANMALIANVILIAGLLSLFGSTLTLPGIAGIVLTIGMAVDANVLIFERIREELGAGKGPINAVETGYRRAWSAILDANVTTFLAALIMFQLGAGPVRGFAVTLATGVVTSVFTAYVLTRLFAGRYLLKNRPKTLSL